MVQKCTAERKVMDLPNSNVLDSPAVNSLKCKCSPVIHLCHACREKGKARDSSATHHTSNCCEQ